MKTDNIYEETFLFQGVTAVTYSAESRGSSLNPTAYFIKLLIVILYLVLIKSLETRLWFSS